MAFYHLPSSSFILLYSFTWKSWASSGPDDSQGSPERSGSGAPSTSISVAAEGVAEDVNVRVASIPSAADQPPLIQHSVTWREEDAPTSGDAAPVVRGAGYQSPHQSRLLSYTQSSHIVHRSPLPQSHMLVDQHQVIPQHQFFVGHSPPPVQRALYPSNEISPFGGSIGEGSYYVPLRSPQPQLSFLPSPLESRSTYYQQSPQSLSFYHPTIMHSAQANPYTPISRPHTMPPSSTSTTTTRYSENDASTDRFDRRLRSAGSVPTTPVRSTIASSDKQDSPKPLPQNLRGDPFRSAKVKTELCRFFNTEKGCVYGDKCNYAHGEQELKFNKLMDLERAGLVDVEVFRCHVCFTWVATGAW